ncbi:CBS domain-containing protein CBSX1 [Forsythia ovata]|uniref:CBS domain-containing protein CBSX1 n=1 Tax=Forsythia ovata TaxID=205694 RepID=A0ABD1WQK5_9LAMI
MDDENLITHLDFEQQIDVSLHEECESMMMFDTLADSHDTYIIYYCFAMFNIVRRSGDVGTIGQTPLSTLSLEMLVENRITGFPVIDDDWKLVGLVSDYDLLALDSISGTGRTDTNMFPEVDSTWKTFNEVQNLLSKTNGKMVGDLMTPAPVVVCESTNLEDAARILLETKYRRLPVVDGDGKLVGIITRGNVVRAALQIKRSLV